MPGLPDKIHVNSNIALLALRKKNEKGHSKGVHLLHTNIQKKAINTNFITKKHSNFIRLLKGFANTSLNYLQE